MRGSAGGRSGCVALTVSGNHPIYVSWQGCGPCAVTAPWKMSCTAGWAKESWWMLGWCLGSGCRMQTMRRSPFTCL